MLVGIYIVNGVQCGTCDLNVHMLEFEIIRIYNLSAVVT